MFEEITVIRLQEETELSSFDYGNEDLNNFLFNDAKAYLKRLLSVTYLLKRGNDTVAFFSLSNDRISVPDSDKSTWRKVKSCFPHAKHRSDYPSVKIGRLAVDLKYQRCSVGTVILNFIESMFVSNNRTGCTFVTVDALPSALPFYKKNGFVLLNKRLEETEGRTMTLFYDLSQLL